MESPDGNTYKLVGCETSSGIGACVGLPDRNIASSAWFTEPVNLVSVVYSSSANCSASAWAFSAFAVDSYIAPPVAGGIGGTAPLIVAAANLLTHEHCITCLGCNVSLGVITYTLVKCVCYVIPPRA